MVSVQGVAWFLRLSRGRSPTQQGTYSLRLLRIVLELGSDWNVLAIYGCIYISPCLYEYVGALHSPFCFLIPVLGCCTCI